MHLTLRCLLALCLFVTVAASADPQSKSFSSWQFNGQQAVAIYTIANREITRLPDYQFTPEFSEVIASHIRQTIALANNGEACDLTELSPRRAATGYTQLLVIFECQREIGDATITIATLLDAAPSHVHFAKFQPGAGTDVELLFTRRMPSQILNLDNTHDAVTSADNTNSFITYMALGFEHILVGIDHIAFLLTLMLLARGIKDIFWVVTGFTVGHSITLSLAVLELVTPDIMVVEAMIGFTIALVAIENISCQSQQSRQAALYSGCALGLAVLMSALSGHGPPLLSLFGLTLFTYCYLNISHSKAIALRLRPLITLGFGMVHGFGFANVLMEVGLPTNRILPALFGFNLGVELGQVAIVLLITAAAWLFFKLVPGRGNALLPESLSAALCGLGIFWFVQRGWF